MFSALCSSAQISLGCGGGGGIVRGGNGAGGREIIETLSVLIFGTVFSFSLLDKLKQILDFFVFLCAMCFGHCFAILPHSLMFIKCLSLKQELGILVEP